RLRGDERIPTVQRYLGWSQLWRNYLRRHAGGAPTNASKASAKAVSSPRANTPPLAASTRLLTPASFGSFENPPTQPHAVRRFSRSSTSQLSAPEPSTKTVPTARYGPSGDDRANIASPVVEPRSLSKTRPVASRTRTALL